MQNTLMISNKNLWIKNDFFPFELILWRQRLLWLGHVLRLSNSRICKNILYCYFEGTRKHLRRPTWRKQIIKDLALLNNTNWLQFSSVKNDWINLIETTFLFHKNKIFFSNLVTLSRAD